MIGRKERLRRGTTIVTRARVPCRCESGEGVTPAITELMMSVHTHMHHRAPDEPISLRAEQLGACTQTILRRLLLRGTRSELGLARNNPPSDRVRVEEEQTSSGVKMLGMHCGGLNGVFNRRVCRIVCITTELRVGELVSQALRGSAVDASAVSAVTTGPALEGKGRQPFPAPTPVIHVGPCCHHPSINVPCPPYLRLTLPCCLRSLLPFLSDPTTHTLAHTCIHSLSVFLPATLRITLPPKPKSTHTE